MSGTAAAVAVFMGVPMALAAAAAAVSLFTIRCAAAIVCFRRTVILFIEKLGTEMRILYIGRMAHIIVFAPALRVDQGIVCFLDPAEALFMLRIAGIDVRMVLFGQLAVGQFDLFGSCIRFYAQHIVIVFHRVFPPFVPHTIRASRDGRQSTTTASLRTATSPSVWTQSGVSAVILKWRPVQCVTPGMP